MSELLQDFNLIESYDILKEAVHGAPRYFLRGVFSRVNVPNKNKRIYTEDVMNEAIGSIQNLIETRGFVGELDHPPTPKINVSGISHVITKLHLHDEGAVLGEAEALDTEPGKHLQKLMDAKVRLGVSTRGVGNVEPYKVPDLGEGYVRVKPGYQMKAIDIVFDPSAEAFPNYVRESTEHKIYLGQTDSFKKVWTEIFGGK
jgi:hypothetical protein